MNIRFPVVLTIIICAAAFGQGRAETKKILKFWNLTSTTINELYTSPPGKTQWSANLCLADPDHSVDPDERLNLPDVAAGTYDVLVVDQGGRRCVFHNVVVRGAGPYAFSIAEDQMKGCSEP